MAIEELAGVLDALCALDPDRLGDAETVVALQRCAERLAAVTTRAVAAFDAGRSWEADGARTASAWVAARCRLATETPAGGPGAGVAPHGCGGGGVARR